MKIISKIINFLLPHGFHIMMIGLATIIISAFTYAILIMTHYITIPLKNNIFLIALIGLIVYFLGRVLFHISNKKTQKNN